MKASENSMDFIEKAENTMIIGSELGHGLAKEQDAVPTKKCPKCCRVLPVTEFYTNSHTKDGYQDKCKECQLAWNREYQKRKKEEKRLASLNVEDKVETKKVIVDEKECTMAKVYTNPELAKFTPREMMAELKARGFKWEYMLEPQRKVYFDKI